VYGLPSVRQSVSFDTAAFWLRRTVVWADLHACVVITAAHSSLASVAVRGALKYWENNFCLYSVAKKSGGSAVGIATGYGPDDRGTGVRVPVVPRIFTSSCRYCNWLRTGRQRVRSLSPSRVKIFHFFISSGPDLGPAQPPIQWVTGAFYPGSKAAEA
jgi:hypothetical protein